MKVYLAEYHNGEAYEDFHQWHGKKVYKKRENCLQEILDNGFIKDKDDEGFIKPDEEYGETYYVNIEELELVD